MRLKSIEVLNFRNLSGSISFADGLNIISGLNGQGKTNWLEAISLLASTRSFRTSKLNEAIRFNEESAFVSGSVRESPTIVRDLRVILQGGTKSLMLNGKKEPAHQYLGHLHAVVFNSDKLEIVRGLPEHRRRFLDDGIVALHPPFVRVLADYGRVIKQKTSLLLSLSEGTCSPEEIAAALDPWNQQLINLGARIHKSRVRFVERIKETLEKKLFADEELTVRYRSSMEGKGELGNYLELFAERLKLRLTAEIAAGHCLVGPHRDDLEIMFDGHDLRKFGSAGQQRSALLLLQLANIAVYHTTRGDYPLFLLDDIDAELDYLRIGKLLDYLRDKTQTFVTTSKDSFIERFGSDARCFKINAGIAEI